MAKAADEVSTSPPLRGPHWIGLREEIERRWRRLGETDPTMGMPALKEIDDELESGERPSKLIEGDHEELVVPERWREGELEIHVECDLHWLDDEQRVKVPDLSTLRVKARGEPERQLLLLVWAPPDQGTAGASVKPQGNQKRARPQGDRVAIMLRAEFPPDGRVPPPSELADSDLVARIQRRFPDPSPESGSRGIPSRQVILRTAGRLPQK